jgi:hypothetical protein
MGLRVRTWPSARRRWRRRPDWRQVQHGSGTRLGTGGAIISYTVSAIGVLIMITAGLAPTGWAAAAVRAAGQFCHGWAMGVRTPAG